MRSRTSGLIAAGLAAAVVSSGVASPDARAARCPNADQVPQAATVDEAATATLCLVNRRRVRRGLPRLHSQPQLRRVGRRYARQMVRRQFFSHTSPTGRTMVDRLEAVGYAQLQMTWTVGEALAWGAGDRATPASIVAAWMASRPHRHLLLEARFRDVGIGVAPGAPTGPGLEGAAATYATELGVRH